MSKKQDEEKTKEQLDPSEEDQTQGVINELQNDGSYRLEHLRAIERQNAILSEQINMIKDQNVLLEKIWKKLENAK